MQDHVVTSVEREDGQGGGTTDTYTGVYPERQGRNGDGIRVSQAYKVGTTVNTTHYYFGGAYETTDNPSTTKRNYTIPGEGSFAGQTLEMDDGSGLKYTLSDHLSSMSVVLDDSGTQGTQLNEQRYHETLP